jgi:ribonuclease P protein component
LTRADDLRRVRLSGARLRVPSLDVRALPNALPYARIGIVVPKYGATSVLRNLIKRRLRELARRELLAALPPCDVVLWATPSTYRSDFDALRASVVRARTMLTAS